MLQPTDLTRISRVVTRASPSSFSISLLFSAHSARSGRDSRLAAAIRPSSGSDAERRLPFGHRTVRTPSGGCPSPIGRFGRRAAAAHQAPSGPEGDGTCFCRAPSGLKGEQDARRRCSPRLEGALGHVAPPRRVFPSASTRAIGWIFHAFSVSLPAGRLPSDRNLAHFRRRPLLAAENRELQIPRRVNNGSARVRGFAEGVLNGSDLVRGSAGGVPNGSARVRGFAEGVLNGSDLVRGSAGGVLNGSRPSSLASHPAPGRGVVSGSGAGE